MKRGSKGKPISKLFPNFILGSLNICGMGVYELTVNSKTVYGFSNNFFKTYIEKGGELISGVFKCIYEVDDERDISRIKKKYKIKD